MKVLIMKLGYSETLTPEISKTCSLGDVLRTTVILNYFKGDTVNWLIDEKARPLLEGNPFINELIEWNCEGISRLESEQYDTVINLEKVPGVCALAGRITAWKHYGFRFDYWGGKAQAYDKADEVLRIATTDEGKKENGTVWQHHLAEIIGSEWNEMDEYLIPPRKVEQEEKVGLNFMVGAKWPTKEWPLPYWHELGRILEEKDHEVHWQPVTDDLDHYMDWVCSCSSIITCDSLGLHLAIAMKKKVIGIFGPTSEKEVFFYGRGRALTVTLPCRPCYKDKCRIDGNGCMSGVTPRKVYEEWVKLT